MFAKTVAMTEQVPTRTLQQIKSDYSANYAQIVREYEQALSNQEIPLLPISQRHNQLVLDTAREIINGYNIPTFLPFFAFFNGSFGYQDNLLHSDYDINFIYPEKYRPLCYPLEKKFLHDFAFVTDTPLTVSNFQNPAVNFANIFEDIPSKQSYQFNKLFTKFWLQQINSLGYLKDLGKKIRNTTIRRLWEQFFFSSVSLKNKWSSREPILVENYLKKNITESYALGLVEITDSPYFDQFYDNLKNTEVKEEAVWQRLKKLKNLINNKEILVNAFHGKQQYFLYVSAENKFTLYKKNNDNKAIAIKTADSLEELTSVNGFTKLIKEFQKKLQYGPVTDRDLLKEVLKKKGFRLGIDLLNYLKLLLKLDFPPRFPALINNQEIAQFVGEENYQQLVQYIDKLMCLKMAVDHQAYSLPQNQGLHNYQIDDDLIAKLQ